MTINELVLRVLQVGGTITFESLPNWGMGVRISAHRPGLTPITVSASTTRPLKEIADLIGPFSEQLEINQFFSMGEA